MSAQARLLAKRSFVVTAVIAAYTIHVSVQPADARHPYGHFKAEYFSAVLEGVLIVVAGTGCALVPNATPRRREATADATANAELPATAEVAHV